MNNVRIETFIKYIGVNFHDHGLGNGFLACVRAQLFLTLCDPTDCSPPGSSVHGILQARILERLPFLSPRVLPDPGIEKLYACVLSCFSPV